MMRPNLRLLRSLAFLLVSAGTAHAAPPSTPPPGSSFTDPTQYQQPIEEYRTLGIDRRLASFAGTVLDIGDRPISGVEVKLFVEGQLTGSALTDGNGFYDIRAPYDPAADA